jgi:hypothetical protein
MLYKRTLDGQFVPYVPSKSLDRLKTTAACESLPLLSPKHAAAPLAADDAWDGWPDGEFEQDYDWDALRGNGHLRVHWACKNTGGDRKGDIFATSWEQGKRSTRQCMGIIKCDNADCLVLVRPQTTPQGIARQLSHPCTCGAVLSHSECVVRSTMWTWKEGIHYANGGYHTHDRLTHILHLLPNEQAQFRKLVSSHPTIGPLGLIVGVPGVNGPGESVTDISDVLLNADRVRKEKQKVKKSEPQGGDSFIAAFTKFSAEHPGFVVYSQLGSVTVISLQTPFMASQLVKDAVLDGPLNGLVSDAAHGWWRERTSLLVITSAYSPQLLAWAPGIFSYINGASAEHYKYHFLALFQSIAHEADYRGLKVTDDMFAGVSIRDTWPCVILIPCSRLLISVKQSESAFL